MSAIDQDGSAVLIEAVWYRYGTPYVKGFDSMEDARAALDSGEEYEHLSSVGVFVNGRPSLWKYYDDEVLTTDRVDYMNREYAKAKARQ